VRHWLCLTAFVFVLAPCQGRADDEIDNLVKNLRSKDPKIRIGAAEGLMKKGEEASAAAPALCDALLDPSSQVGLAALAAIEKVRPDLYKPLTKIVLERFLSLKIGAVRELGLMRQKALPTINVLLTVLRKELAVKTPTQLGFSEQTRELYAVIRQISPDDLESIKMMTVMAGASSRGMYARTQAIGFLNDWAAADTVKRKEVLPIVKAGLDDQICQASCIMIAGSYGLLATECLPILKVLKLSQFEQTRNLATEAVDKIENAK
jgi:hypothetical protein